jgi:hypothetical protein
MVPDVILARGEFGVMKQPLAAEASAYSYGAAHAISAGRYADEASAANRVEVFGKNVFGERFDWIGVAATYDRLVQVLDANLTTQAQTESRADALLRHAAIAAAAGEIAVRPNCGQELHDVIDVTDAAAALGAATRRVLGVHLRYRPDAGIYEQTLVLGAP